MNVGLCSQKQKFCEFSNFLALQLFCDNCLTRVNALACMQTLIPLTFEDAVMLVEQTEKEHHDQGILEL